LTTSWADKALREFGRSCQAKLSGPGDREAAIRSPIEVLLTEAGARIGSREVLDSGQILSAHLMTLPRRDRCETSSAEGRAEGVPDGGLVPAARSPGLPDAVSGSMT
jgi:hypothetical protein